MVSHFQTQFRHKCTQMHTDEEERGFAQEETEVMGKCPEQGLAMNAPGILMLRSALFLGYGLVSTENSQFFFRLRCSTNGPQ